MQSTGIMRIGFRLLVNDKAKFSALLVGIVFAVFLMTQMTAMFAGILNRAYSTVTNVGAEMWVIDPAVNTPNSAFPLPNFLLDAVLSMDGVKYAAPLYIGGAQVRLASGVYQSVSVVGLDDASLFGRPHMEKGTFWTSMPTTRSWSSTIRKSPSWNIRRSAPRSKSMTFAAWSWAWRTSPRTV